MERHNNNINSVTIFLAFVAGIALLWLANLGVA